jgi:hypothetical protein
MTMAKKSVLPSKNPKMMMSLRPPRKLRRLLDSEAKAAGYNRSEAVEYLLRLGMDGAPLPAPQGRKTPITMSVDSALVREGMKRAKAAGMSFSDAAEYWLWWSLKKCGAQGVEE